MSDDFVTAAGVVACNNLHQCEHDSIMIQYKTQVSAGKCNMCDVYAKSYHLITAAIRTAHATVD
jgi:hypothetical protein